MDMWKKIVQIGQKILGKEFKNPHGLEKELLGALSAYVQPVETVDEGLAISLLKYVIDDDDETCLLTLSGNDLAREKLGYLSHNAEVVQCRAAVVDVESSAPPEFWYRYGRLLEAASFGKTPYYISNQHSNFIQLPAWLVLLAGEIATRFNDTAVNNIQKKPWSVGTFEQIVLEGGLPSSVLVSPILDRGYSYVWRGSSYHYYNDRSVMKVLTGVNDYMARHLDDVKQHLLKCNAEERIFAVEKLHAIEFDFELISDLLAQFGTGSSKTIREAVYVALPNKPDWFRARLERVLKEGSASERNEAVILMWRMFETDCANTLREHASTEKAERVKQTIEKYLATPDSDQPDEQVQLAPVQVDLEPAPLADEVKKNLFDVLESTYQYAMDSYERMMEQWNAPKRPAWMQQPIKPEKISDKDLEKIIAFLEGTGTEFKFSADISRCLYYVSKGNLDVSPPQVKLSHVVRIMYLLGSLQCQKYGFTDRIGIPNPTILENYRAKCNNSFGLRELDAAVATLPGCTPGLVAKSYLAQNEWSSFCDWEADAVWPIFAERSDLVFDRLSPSRSGSSNPWEYGNRSTAFKILAMFPTLPGKFIPLLWDLALGEGKSERRLAQDALNTVPGKVEKIILFLSDGKQNVRSAAAEWLGRLGESSAVEPLKKAFQKEKNEQAKGIIMHALDLLNADVDEFLNRDKLLEEARAGLLKKLPKGIEWLSLDNLPPLHWKDSGKAVEPEIAKWWIVQSIQQKTPVCGPILKRYLSMCSTVDSAKFAKHVLLCWIGRDTETISHEDAVEKANIEAEKMWNAYSQHQWFLDSHKSKESVFKMYYNGFMSTCLYSAIEQKGMLAIVSAAGDSDCVKLSEQYIRKWYGNRTAQCKALVEVLAWISHPLALQALLSIANRFRTKSIKELAAEHVNAVAERRGWTVDELADRTIPDGGFELPVDENGNPIGDSDKAVLEIDFGPRQFVVSLNDQLETVIFPKGETKPIKTLPAPAKSDDQELAKAGKKEFTDAKKIAKEVVKRQTERLYEALCTQREWRFEDWQLYLAKHPIVGRLCVRLAWIVFEPGTEEQGKFIGAYRPLEDGSLTNEQDEEVKFPKDAIVKLAHSCNLSNELVAAWIKHFDDYDVTPLFAQFGRQVFIVPEDRLKSTDMTDFQGHLITSYKLRNRAVKLGYVRGEAEDGGCFYIYKKSFNSLEMQAVLEFTGNCLPEEDVPCALKEFYFVALKDSTHSWSVTKIPLWRVPKVLLSEVYNDVRQIAADGSGFDPKWQEKSYF